MIAHIVLYRPKPGLEAEAREDFVAALVAARRDIAAIRRFTVGRRFEQGPSYRIAGLPDYPYLALIEFDDAAALKSYLGHPVHEGLGRAFRSTLESALVYDYEIADAAEAPAFLAG